MPNGQSERRRSGLSAVGEVKWGTQLCHFYARKTDLLGALAGYFQAGLEQNEKCVWTLSGSFSEQDARQAIARTYPGAPRRIANGDLEFLPMPPDPAALLATWAAQLPTALAEGYTGLRLNLSPPDLAPAADFPAHEDWEAAGGAFLTDRQALLLCCYPQPAESANPVAPTLAPEPPELRAAREAVKRLSQELFIRAAKRTRERTASELDLAREITARLTAERALREAEGRLRTGSALPSVGLAIVHLPSLRIDGNQRFCEILGYTSDELARLDWRQLTHPDDWGHEQADAHQNSVARIAGGTFPNLQSKRWIGKHGQLVHTLSATESLQKPDGTLDFLVFLLQPVDSPADTSGCNHNTPCPAQPSYSHLSGRELEVARQIGMGHSVKDIAAELRLSEKTVSTYRTRLLSKLHLKSTAELIRYSLSYDVPQ
jgi:PAS domain S-box-containing protein